MTPQDIDREHDRLGYVLGWRFMMAPERNLRTSKIALILLNPGGSKYESSAWSQERGSAYVIERWKEMNPGQESLQVQVQGLCRVLNVDASETFSAVFVPFRSRNWQELSRQDEAVAFAKTLWRWALPQSPAHTFVCIGQKIVGPEIANLLSAKPLVPKLAGWGNYKINRYAAPDGRKVLALPHLSRFGLFGREQSERAFLEALQQD